MLPLLVKRIAESNTGSSGEVPVGGPDLTYPVPNAERNDAGIMHHRPQELPSVENSP